MRYDPQQVEVVIVQLREILDPVALMGTIAKKTRYGRKPGPSAWHYTHQLLASYGCADAADKLIDLFASVGVKDEVDAGVWLAEHMDQIP